MKMSELLLMQEQLATGVRAIRFLRPDLRRHLDPIVGDDNILFQQIAGALSDMSDGERVIFNFGLIERFPSSFFQLLMRVRQLVLSRHGEVFLCCFRSEIQPAVELMGGARLFHLTPTEDAALYAARTK